MIYLPGIVYLTLTGTLFCFILYYIAVKSRNDPREPPSVSSKVPILGHLFGVIRHGLPYIVNNGRKHPYPIFTLDFGLTKVYVVNTAKIVQAVQRNYKTIWSEPVLTTAAHRMAGVNAEGVKFLKDSESGGKSISKDVVHAMQPSLLGSALDEMNQTMANNLCTSVDEMVTVDKKSLDLYLWCRRAVTVASSKAVWGSLNPFDDPGVEAGFWDYDSNLLPLLLNFFPQITARKAYYGREKVVASFIKYYNAGGQHNSSSLAHARWKTQDDAGCPTELIARLETAAAIAVLSNTVISAFYTLIDIYSRPELLTLLREEVRQNALQVDEETGTHTIDIAKIRNGCPSLISTFQEVLRFRSTASPMRIVKEDVLISSEYLLKSNSILLMPSRSINYETAKWGHDADTFDPLRFCKDEGKKQSPNSFMSFGTAPGLCPGRHFASGEVLALVAMVVLRFEIEPVGGVWREPGKLNTNAVASTMTPPAEAFDVRIVRITEFEGVEWAFKVTEGNGRFGLVTG